MRDAAAPAAAGLLSYEAAATANARDAKGRRRMSLDRALFHVGLLLVCVAFLLPIVWMLSTSLKSLEQTGEYPPRFTPSPWRPQNYVDVFRHPNFRMGGYTRNTLIIAFLTVAGVTLSSAIAAYGFARI